MRTLFSILMASLLVVIGCHKGKENESIVEKQGEQEFYQQSVDQPNTDQQQDLRKAFLANKNTEEIRTSFVNLPTSEKQKLWISKMEQLEKQNFSPKIKKDIIAIKDFLKNMEDRILFDKFKEASIELSKLIPKEDLAKMFVSLEDYNYKGAFKGKEYLPEFTVQLKEKLEFKNNSITARQPCSCRWCLFTDRSLLRSNCEETREGCGFLRMQSCDKCLFCEMAPLEPLPPIDDKVAPIDRDSLSNGGKLIVP